MILKYNTYRNYSRINLENTKIIPGLISLYNAIQTPIYLSPT